MTEEERLALVALANRLAPTLDSAANELQTQFPTFTFGDPFMLAGLGLLGLPVKGQSTLGAITVSESGIVGGVLEAACGMVMLGTWTRQTGWRWQKPQRPRQQ